MKIYRTMFYLISIYLLVIATHISTAGTTRCNPTMAPGDINTLWGFSDNDIFLGYRDGDIAKWNGTIWEHQRTNPDTDEREIISGFWGSDPQNVWAVGSDTHNALITHWNGFNWEDSELVFSGSLSDIWGSAPDNIFAVGSINNEYGCLRFDGNTWTPVDTGCQSLTAIWGYNSSNIYATGRGCGVIKWDGSSWTNLGSGIDWPIDLWGFSENDLFVLDYGGRIWQWDGLSWDLIGNVPYDDDSCIWGSAPNDLYVSISDYLAYHYDGNSWKQVDYHAHNLGINSIWGTGSQSIYVVGDDGNCVHYDGIGWKHLNTGWKDTILSLHVMDEDQLCLAGTDGQMCIWTKEKILPLGYFSIDDVCRNEHGEVYALSQGKLIKRYNSGWELVFDCNAIHFTDITAASGNMLFLMDTKYVLHRFDGTTLHSIHRFDDGIVRDIWAADPGNIYVGGGEDGIGFLLHGDGQNWTQVEIPDLMYLSTIWGTDPNNIYITTYRDSVEIIWHYDGISWTQLELGLSEYVREFWGLSENCVFAIGSNGDVAHWDGMTWTIRQTPVSDSLSSIHGSDPDNIIAVGRYGAMVHWNGQEWMALDSGVESNLLKVVSSLDGDFFAFAWDGTALEQDGSAWRQMFCPESRDIEDIWVSENNHIFIAQEMVSPSYYNGHYWQVLESSSQGRVGGPFGVWGSSETDVFFVGSTIQHFDGESIEIMTAPEFGTLYGVWGAGPDDVYALGHQNTIHRDGTQWTEVADYPGWSYIWGLDSDNIYSVSKYGDSVSKWTGNSWGGFGFPSNTLSNIAAIHGTSSDSIYGVSITSGFAHWNGIEWTVTYQHQSADINDSSSLRENVFYLAGAGGIILKVDHSLSVELKMPGVFFNPGDSCWLQADVNNPGALMENATFFTILDACGELFFYPSWCHYPGQCPSTDFEVFNFRQGTTTLMLIPDFSWPDAGSSPCDLAFYSAVVDMNAGKIVGDMGTWTFRY